MFSQVVLVCNSNWGCLQLFSEQINFVEKYDEGSVFEEKIVQHLPYYYMIREYVLVVDLFITEYFFALLHPVCILILVQSLVVVAQGDDE